MYQNVISKKSMRQNKVSKTSIGQNEGDFGLE